MHFRYGDSHPRETLDLYGESTASNDAPIHVYFSGGYWLELHGRDSAYTVKPMWKEGIVTVVPDYARAPGGKGLGTVKMNYDRNG